MSKVKRFIFDSLSNYINMFFKIGIYFISIPIFLDLYGKELYGVYILTFGIASSFQFFDFGISNSLIRYTARFKTSKRLDQFVAEISFSLSTLIYSVIFISILFILLAVFSFRLFNLPDEFQQTARYLFLIAIPFTVSVFVANFTKSLLNGLGHFFKRNLFQAISILTLLSNLLLVYLFHIGIMYFALISILPNVIAVIIDLIYLNKFERILLDSRLYKINLSWKYVFNSQFSSFNLNIFKNSIVSFFSREIDKPIISIFLSTNLLVGYDILMRPYSIAKSLFAGFFFVVEQKLQRNTDNEERIKKMVIAFSRSNLILGFLFLTIVFVAYPGFVVLWLPKENFLLESNWAFLALVNLVIGGFYKAQFSLLSLSDDNRKSVYLSVVSVSINLIVSIGLVKYLGILAVVLGTTVQAMYNLVYFFHFSKRKYSISFYEYLNLKLIFFWFLILVPIFYLRSALFFVCNNWFDFFIRITLVTLPIFLLVYLMYRKEFLSLKEWK